MRRCPIAEVAAFVDPLRQQEGVGARALEFAILTAARTGEVIGARWGEINIAERLWTVPAGRMKAGKEHRAPLSRRCNGDRREDGTRSDRVITCSPAARRATADQQYGDADVAASYGPR